MKSNVKLILGIICISLAFDILIGLDITPFLRGPGIYPPDWRWPYFFVNTIPRIWVPISLILLILSLFIYLDNKKEGFLQRKEKYFLPLLIVLCFAFQIAVLFFSRSGIFVLLHRIINPDLNGYFTASLNISDASGFLRNYNDSVLNLPMHAKGHPPGAVLFFYAINKISLLFSSLYPFIERFNPSHLDTRFVWNNLLSSQKFGALISTIIIPFLSSSIIVPLYFLGKKLYGLKTSIRSIFLYIFIPSVILFIPINDVFLAFFPLTSFLFLLKGLREENKYYLFVSGFIFFLGIFFSLSLLPLGIIFLALFTSEEFLRFRLGNHPRTPSRCLSVSPGRWVTWEEMVRNGIFPILGFLMLPVLLFLFLQFNFLQISKTLMTGLPPSRSYFVWMFYNLYDFFVFAGVPILISFVLMLKRFWTSQNNSRDFLFLGFILMLFILNFSGFVRGEVGRIWLPFIPILILSVSNFFTKDLKFSTKHFLVILLLQSVQVLAMQEFWVALW